jgi:hypothetical protein
MLYTFTRVAVSSDWLQTEPVQNKLAAACYYAKAGPNLKKITHIITVLLSLLDSTKPRDIDVGHHDFDLQLHMEVITRMFISLKIKISQTYHLKWLTAVFD